MAWSSEPKGQSALRYSSHPRRYASRPARRSPGGRSLIEWPSESESWPEPNGRKESLRDIRYGSLQQVLRGWNVGSPSACDSHACGGDRWGAFGPAKTVPTVPFSLRQFPGNGGIPLGQIPVRLLKSWDRSVFGDGLPEFKGRSTRHTCTHIVLFRVACSFPSSERGTQMRWLQFGKPLWAEIGSHAEMRKIYIPDSAEAEKSTARLATYHFEPRSLT